MSVKTAFIHHCKDIGGAGKSLLRTAKMLSGHDITIYAPQDSSISGFYRQNGFCVSEYSLPIGSIEYYSGGPSVFSRTYAKRRLRCPACVRYFTDEIMKNGYDLVILNSITLAYLIKPIKEKTGAKVLCFVRETFPENGSSLILKKYRKLLSEADGVSFISDYDRKFFNIKSLHSFTLRNSVPNDFFNAEDQKDALNKLGIEYSNDSFYVLYLGGASELKGISVLSDAIEKADKNIHFLIAGDKKEAFAKYGFEKQDKKISYLGILTDVHTAYSACNALVFPSTSPHQSRPAFEAGACGKPVIISAFPQTAEDITDGENGLCAAPSDSNALADCINKLNSDRKLAEELGQRNREKALRLHSESGAEKILAKEITKIIENKPIINLHIMTAANYGTVDGYTKLINGNFNNDEHLFIIRDYAENPAHSLENFSNIVWMPDAEKSEFNSLLAYIEKADHIYWHSMGWYWTTQLKMLLKPSLMKKSTWVEWGADLFNWKRPDGNRIIRFGVNVIMKKWRQKVGSVVVIFPTDENVYRKTFNRKQNIRLATYSVYKNTQIDDQKPEKYHDDSLVNILVGHSATPLCNHIEVLDSLSKFRDENIKIYIPLSYGDKEYAKTVMTHATEIFGEKAVFQLKNMPLWDYVHFLWDIDIAIFKVYRQIALGNICRLLYMCKKVYMPKGSLLYDYYVENNTEVYDCDKIKEMTFEEFRKKPIMTEPSDCIKERMNQGAVIEQWNRVFDDFGGNNK